MKKMMVILILVVALSGAFAAYGSGSVNEQKNFAFDFSQYLRSATIKFGYNAAYGNITTARGYVTVKMDNAGGASVKVQLRGTDHITVIKESSTGQLKKGESMTFYAYARTPIGEYYYGYVDYRGASTSPDIYTYEVTEK